MDTYSACKNDETDFSFTLLLKVIDFQVLKADETRNENLLLSAVVFTTEKEEVSK